MSRIPLSVVQPTIPLIECTPWGRCCTYVGVGIHPPSRPRWATDILFLPAGLWPGRPASAEPVPAQRLEVVRSRMRRVARKARIDR